MVDVQRLRELSVLVNATTEGSWLDRMANGERIALACADFLREHGRELLAIAEAYAAAPVARMSPCSVISVSDKSALIPQGPDNPEGYLKWRTTMRQMHVSSTSVDDDDARKVAGQTVRLVRVVGEKS